ncbi:MAG: c-type cytochrome [Opitutus sp.]|nr:c-type cytochrome [Opitutus sp.]
MLKNARVDTRSEFLKPAASFPVPKIPESPPVWCGFVLLTEVLLGLTAHAASTPASWNTERASSVPLPALEAAAKMKLPPGFRSTVYAAEPDVCQPISMTTDSRGRLWVAENYTYVDGSLPAQTELHDRIVILEDTDNDGCFDKRTVFWDKAQRLTSIEIGFGGVWALCLPNLIFIPDRNGDDIPDREPEVVLDGFDFIKARHTMANGLRWGPDGWLYGRQGILGTSTVGKPGAPLEKRIAINVGIWRFHPRRGDFEIVAEGTTNPWGMDWDQHGQAFFINTVIGHLWQVIPGAHYRRMFGDDPSPRIYESLEQYADHVHWASSEVWTDVRKGVTDATQIAGGGHAHTGLLIYQGGQWPSEWSGKLLTINFHGRLLNVERLERAGSAYVGRREDDKFQSADRWFRGIDLIAAPDGGIFVSDWSDAGECHEMDGIHRSSGRIYKLSYGEPKPRAAGDLARLDGAALARLQLNDNDWLARQARRVLADRADRGTNVADAYAELKRILVDGQSSAQRVRALWALHVSGGLAAEQLTPLLADRDEYVRAWAVRLIVDVRNDVLSASRMAGLVQLAKSEPSALVRLALASALQRLPVAQRAPLAEPLLSRAEDVRDHNIPLMLWYGIEPIADDKKASFERLIAAARIPQVQRLAARRLAEDIDSSPARVNSLLLAMTTGRSVESRQAVLDGIGEALSGRRKAPQPAAWTEVQAKLSAGADAPLRNRLRDLSALFGDGRALEEFRAMVLNSSADLPQRNAALQVLIEARAEGLRALCDEILPVRGLSAGAAAGLALSADLRVAERLLTEWPKLYGGEKPPVMSVLMSRRSWAAKALDALAAGIVKREEISPFQARRIRAYHDEALTKRLTEVWGPVADESERDRVTELAKWAARFTPEALAGADKARGRAVFKASCAACHTLNGEGGVIAPDLTGAARDNLNYLLENLLFPSAVVPDEYRLTTVTMKDGRALSGMIRARTAKTLKVQSISELIALSVTDIAKEDVLPVSLMPPGLLDSLSANDARDLLAYLMAK